MKIFSIIVSLGAVLGPCLFLSGMFSGNGMMSKFFGGKPGDSVQTKVMDSSIGKTFRAYIEKSTGDLRQVDGMKGVVKEAKPRSSLKFRPVGQNSDKAVVYNAKPTITVYNSLDEARNAAAAEEAETQALLQQANALKAQ
jgi:hypothetical protein